MPLPDSDLKKLEYLKHEFKKYSTPVLTWIRKGSMAKLDLAAIFVAFIVLPAVMSDTPLEFGMEMSSKAYDAVCWYENLKQFPNTHSKDYNNCAGMVAFQKKQVMTTNQDYFKTYPDKKEMSFGEWVAKNEMKPEKIDVQYNKECGGYLKDPKAQPASDEGDSLNDGGNEYPYKAYAYCLMSTLREKHGDEAIEAVKGEITHSKKDWMQTLLDRDNEFRARHGVESLQVNRELNQAAQAHADKNARECKMEHSKNTDPGRQWRNNGTGESLSAGNRDDKQISAYQASNGWYEEIKDYPYPKGYDGKDQQLFSKIGHFTQSVWKDSKYVGYGYAYNADCAKKGAYTRYIAARYSPPGNFNNDYRNNVLPIQ